MYAKNYLLDPKEKNLGVKEKLSLRKFGAKSSLPDRSFFKKRAQHPDCKIWTHFSDRAHRLLGISRTVDKQAKKMQPVQVVVGEASPGLGLVVVVALSLMSTSLQKNVSCSSSASRAYASVKFPTTGTETESRRRSSTQGAAKQPFPRRDPRKSQNSFLFDQS